MSAQDLALAATDAGFRGDGLVTAIAIGLAESGGTAGARGYDPGPPASVDRGPWQINSVYHAEVSDACADDFACAARAVYAISSGGSNWSPWATWNQGTYRRFWDQALAAAGGNYSVTNNPPALPAPGPRSLVPVVIFGVLVLLATAAF